MFGEGEDGLGQPYQGTGSNVPLSKRGMKPDSHAGL